MATTIRPELSEKNPYWIEKHRYYELKHFCLQYPIWRKAYVSLNGFNGKPIDWAMFIVTSTLGDPTAKVGIARAYYSERTDMIERVAEQTDQQLAPYILKAVTEGWSYDILKVRLGILYLTQKHLDLPAIHLHWKHLKRTLWLQFSMMAICQELRITPD